jgi:hypothetical protein
MKLNTKFASAGVVALAMALGCGVAQASILQPGTLDPAAPTPFTYSLQGQQTSGVAAAQTLPVLVIDLNADYTLSDAITLTIAGATVGGATAANLTNVPALTQDNGIYCFSGPVPAPGAVISPAPLVIGYISQTGSGTLNLRVTQKNVLSAANLHCTIRGIQVTAASLSVLTTVTGQWQAVTAGSGNIPFDGSNLSTLASVIDQFAVNINHAFNGIIDVNAPSLRKNFTADYGNAGLPGLNKNTDVFSATTTNNTAGITGPIATLDGVGVTLTGATGFPEAASVTGGPCTTLDATVADATNNFPGVPTAHTITGTADCKSLVYADTAPQGAGNRLHSVGVGQDLKATPTQHNPQTFTVTVTFNYHGTVGGPLAKVVGPVSGGAWTLNGFQAFVAYMPFGPTISQILYLTNKSTLPGNITIDAYNEAGTKCSAIAAGTSQPGAVLQLSTALFNGITNCYGASYAGKVSFNVTANIPASLAELYSAYNVNGNRLTVINNSNGKGTFNVCQNNNYGGGPLAQGGPNCITSSNGGGL